MRFGELVRELRTQKRITLRDFCQTNGHDPSNWSKMERGELPPPSTEEDLAKLAKQLGLRNETKEWKDFFDLASLERGRIPPDLRSDAEVVKMLPLFFRTLRGQKNNAEELDKVVKFLRRR